MRYHILLECALKQVRPRSDRPNADVFAAMGLVQAWHGRRKHVVVGVVDVAVERGRIDSFAGALDVEGITLAVGVGQRHVGQVVVGYASCSEDIVTAILNRVFLALVQGVLAMVHGILVQSMVLG
jgi:hypothetical protein